MARAAGFQIGEPMGIADGGAAAGDGRRAGSSIGLMGETPRPWPGPRGVDEYADEATLG
jgi:hypothetical protein